MIRIGHQRGLCNRLDVMATGLLLAAERGEPEIELVWPVNEDLPAHFAELFLDVPGVRVIEREVDTIALQTCYEAQTRLPEDYRKSDLYGTMLRRVVARAVPEVTDEVEAFEARHGLDASRGAGRVGVHVRRCEQWVSISPFAQPSRYYEAVMRAFPRDTQFFLSTDSQEAFSWFESRFGRRVFQREKRANNRSCLAGVREGFIDMLLLSRSNAIIGTADSSFSALSAYAGDRPLFMVETFPVVPKGWPGFSRTRWMWAHRHFLVESTYWRVVWSHRIPVPGAAAAVRRRLGWLRVFRPARLWTGRP